MEISRLLIHNSSNSAFRTYCRQNDPVDHLSSIFVQSEESSDSPNHFNQVKTFFLNGKDKSTKDKKPNGRKPRTTFSLDQSDILEKEYKSNEYLNRSNRLKLAERLKLTEGQIKIWFQNRRAKDKRIEKAQLDQHLRCLRYGYDPSALFYRANVETSSETKSKTALN